MSAALYKKLQWLPTPDDFPGACKALAEVEGDVGAAIRALANHALTDAQIQRLSSQIGRLRSDGKSMKPLIPYTLGVIGNGTLDLIVPALEVAAARHGFLLDCVATDYGQGVQEALNPDSLLNQAKCDSVLMAFDYRGLGLDAAPGNELGAERRVMDAIDLIKQMQDALNKHSGAHVIVQTVAPPAETLFGSLDRSIAGTMHSLAESFNRALLGLEKSDTRAVLDVATLANTVGLSEWYSPTQWNLAKLPFAADCVALYADHVLRLIGALRGKSRRGLILDLDNTLWGGVIGDDGMEGILIGEGDGTGEAFLSVQRMALNLRDRGIVLAVSSKNTDSVARQAFREHPDMLLREDHIAVFQANWNDKATNIKAIAEEISLGLDAFVFLDDNPVERGLVRQYLPQVAVPELPEDPALYARTLAAAGYFEATTFSAEDRQRAADYQNNARRVALGKNIGDVKDYLAALDMEISFAPFDAVNRARITQLINKSNQFNLTTKRYRETDIREAELEQDVFTLQVRLSDRFGDNGMICVVICRPHGPQQWIIDTWLMSCRVLGRKVETMVLAYLVEQAREAGVTTLIGEYRPTDRNGLVANHYANLGFEAMPTNDAESQFWTLSTATEIEVPPIRRLESAPVAQALSA